MLENSSRSRKASKEASVAVQKKGVADLDFGVLGVREYLDLRYISDRWTSCGNKDVAYFGFCWEVDIGTYPLLRWGGMSGEEICRKKINSSSLV